jgi:hypothetical protein
MNNRFKYPFGPRTFKHAETSVWLTLFDSRHKLLNLSMFWHFTIKFSLISIETVGILYDFQKKAV